jgi:hypothetical protein
VSRWKRPLTAKEVRQIAKNLGFQYRNTEGGHENWVREQPPPFRKMTIDAHLAPFSYILIEYMARQAGVRLREFYDALNR